MLLDDPSVEEIARMGGLEATGLAGLRDPRAALDCMCVCHTRQFTLPIAAVHDEGRTCPCQPAHDERACAAAPLWDLYTGCNGSDEPSGATMHGERQVALAHAWRYGMRITIECDDAPTIIFGTYRGYEFWFHASDDHGQLHLGDLDGPVIAEGAVDGPIDAVDFIRDLLDRYDRVGNIRGHPTPASTWCRERGGPRPP